MARVITVDFTGVESGGGRVRVPEGDYGLEITKVVGKKSESKNKPYLLISFKITSGHKRGVGKVITHNCSLQTQALWNLRNLLEACGKQVPAKAVKIDIDKMVGYECAGTIQDDEPYEGKIKSIIGTFFPLADLGNTDTTGDELETAGAGETDEEESMFDEKPAKVNGKEKKKVAKKKEEAEEEEENSDQEELFS